MSRVLWGFFWGGGEFLLMSGPSWSCRNKLYCPNSTNCEFLQLYPAEIHKVVTKSPKGDFLPSKKLEL